MDGTRGHSNRQPYDREVVTLTTESTGVPGLQDRPHFRVENDKEGEVILSLVSYSSIYVFYGVKSDQK